VTSLQQLRRIADVVDRERMLLRLSPQVAAPIDQTLRELHKLVAVAGLLDSDTVVVHCGGCGQQIKLYAAQACAGATTYCGVCFDDIFITPRLRRMA